MPGGLPWPLDIMGKTVLGPRKEKSWISLHGRILRLWCASSFHFAWANMFGESKEAACSVNDKMFCRCQMYQFGVEVHSLGGAVDFNGFESWSVALLKNVLRVFENRSLTQDKMNHHNLYSSINIISLRWSIQEI
jgi:hypothetical protein